MPYWQQPPRTAQAALHEGVEFIGGPLLGEEVGRKYGNAEVGCAKTLIDLLAQTITPAESEFVVPNAHTGLAGPLSKLAYKIFLILRSM